MPEALRALRDLGEFLEARTYRALVHMLTNGRVHQTPWARCPAPRLARLPERTAALVRLFHMGETVDGAADLLGGRLLDGLVELGLAQPQRAGASLGPYFVIPYEGLLLIGQRWEPGAPTPADHLWLGTDTTFVSRVVSPGRARRVLDLCTGMGTHALVMASRGAEACGVDVNPVALRVATWNAWLNGLQDRIEWRQGDLFAPLGGQRFDYVVSSPPFLPYPDDGATPLLFATAGPDGLALMMRILDGLGAHLAPGGRALFLAAGFGDEGRPYFADELAHRAAHERWRIVLLLLGDGGAAAEMRRLGRELPTVADDLATLASGRSESERYHSVLVEIDSAPGASAGFEVVDARASWHEGLAQLRASGRAVAPARSA